ncbi:MAG: Ldh family oxidoreductase [Desulfovibrio sp.]|jgi:ureidoglycolate dehydrogenase (NAD+)|nr:Ldh family oxidoreductase [Desulfovibrio sp.]
MRCFDPSALKKLFYAILARNGVCEDACFHVSEAVIQASLRGVDSHGINLFPHYYAALKAGRINARPRFTPVRTGPSAIVFDADHGFGHHAGAVAMQAAVDSAKENGVGAVSVKHSSHFGAAAYYALSAARQGCLGLCFTNTNDSVLAYNATKPFFGTNPVCLAAPMADEDPFTLDMATSVVSMHSVRNCLRTGALPAPGQAYDVDGKETRDPAAVRCLGPVGGYKGYGLGMMVELLCGMLTGGPVGPEIIPIGARLDTPRYLSHFFTAVDIARFQDPQAFAQRLRSIAEAVRSLPRADPDVPVMIPGDPEKRCFRQRLVTGIPVDDALYRALTDIDEAFAGALLENT